MSVPIYKSVPREDWEIGKEYFIMKNETRSHMFHFVYQGNNKIINLYTGKEEEVLEDITHFERYWRAGEKEAVYKENYINNKSKHQLNIIGLFTDLSDCDGEHENWNAWCSFDAYEMLDNLLDEDFFVVGCAPAPWGKQWLDAEWIALVIADYQTGARRWCHFQKDWLEDVREELTEEYKEIERIADKYANS